LLEVESVVKEYQRRRVVDGVSFHVERGDILGFLGPNGAGKTTTIRMIMGITAPDSGTIRFSLEGRPSGDIPRPRIGYLPEERGLYKNARVIDVLLFLAGLKGMSTREAKREALNWLERLGLGAHARSKVEELSKGMAQKVQFIAAVLHRPDLIVLDEPFSGLDPANQELFKAEIRRIAEEGAAILLSSHQMNLVEETCGRIFLIHQGRRVHYGPLHEIKAAHGGHRLTLITSDPAWHPPPLPQLERVRSEGGRWHALLSPGVSPAEALRALPADAPIEEAQVSRLSLHDIFIRSTTGGYGAELGSGTAANGAAEGASSS